MVLNKIPRNQIFSIIEEEQKLPDAPQEDDRMELTMKNLRKTGRKLETD